LNCCNPCATTETVNVPGTEGTAGVDGTNGINAYTHLTTTLLIPVAPNTVVVGVESALWMVIGQVVIVGEGVTPTSAPNGWAHFEVAGLPSATSVTLLPLDYLGDTAALQTLDIGCNVSPAGLQGPAGP
jgi:hypothetical protein